MDLTFFAHLWAFSISPYGVWLWSFAAMIVLGIASDIAEARARRRHALRQIERIKRRAR